MLDICGCFSDTPSRVLRNWSGFWTPLGPFGREVEEPRTAPYLAWLRRQVEAPSIANPIREPRMAASTEKTSKLNSVPS